MYKLFSNKSNAISMKYYVQYVFKYIMMLYWWHVMWTMCSNK